MKNPLRPFGLRFTTGHAILVAAAAPPAIFLTWHTTYQWWSVAGVAVVALLAVVTFNGRRLTGWVGALSSWLWRHRRPPVAPSEPIVGATVMPGDHVAVRWQGDDLVALIELVARPFTPSVVVDGRVHTDDVIDTELVENLLAANCPDLEAEVVSAGHRVGRRATDDVITLYEKTIGADPAPAVRRTWIVLHAHPMHTRRSAQRRATGVAGLAQYLVASTTRIADQLSSHGVDARCGRSFDDYDHATEVNFLREKWSKIKGEATFTAAYTVSGGPDVWWSVPAVRTVTRVRVAPGMAPRSTVLLTTSGKPKRPKGFARVSGAQRAALHGQVMVTDGHCQLPIGSAGVLVGETTNRCPVYMPFDDVDSAITIGDPKAFMQFAVRAAAAGGSVTLRPQFRELAGLIGAEIGPEAKVAWHQATTYIGAHPGLDRVMLRGDVIGTPRHRSLPIRPVAMTDEHRYETALPR